MFGAEGENGAPLLDRLLLFTTNITLSWGGLPGVNTLAYYECL
jgi:hypothetical protein